MEKLKIVLVGIGGYGANYPYHLRDLLNAGDDRFVIEAVVDPFASKSHMYSWLVEYGCPFYDTLDDFYAAHTADLAFIATPIPLHRDQCITCMRHGTNVLCEKPICPTVQDAEILRQVSEETGKFLAVGFQMSFSRPILSLKRDILSGRFGKPLYYKAFVSWQRFLSYYKHTWKGKYHDNKGNWILDCVLTNATAHYLHNLFFVAGPALDEAAMPLRVWAEAYRVKPDMETPDVFVMRGDLPGNVPFWYGCSYSLTGDKTTRLEIRFERAVVRINEDVSDEQVRVTLADGTVLVYGDVTGAETYRKMDTAIAAAIDPDSAKITCTVKTALPHLKCANAIFDLIPNQPIPESYRVTLTDPSHPEDSGVFAHTIRDNLLECYALGKLPCEMGYAWAKPAVTFRPAEVTAFDGSRFK